MTKYAVITGGAGFIGSHLAARLAGRGQKVVICDWLGDGEKWRNVRDISAWDFIAPSSLFAFLEAHPDEIETIFHLGAISATTETDGDKLVESNIRLSIDLWNWCVHHGVPFIYASSAAVYGDGTHGFNDDWSLNALERLSPLNPYGWSKLFVDKKFSLEIANGRQRPPQWVGLRFFNVFGVRERHKASMQSVVSQIIPQILADEPVRLFRSHNPAYGDGGQMRDFIYIEDCLDIIDWLVANPEVSGIFNLGTGVARSFSELVHATYEALGKTPKIEFVDTPLAIREKYQYFTEASIKSLRAVGCEHEFLTLEDGVNDCVKNWLEHSGFRVKF